MGNRIPLCDACGESCINADDYATDDEVCRGSDGPGFFICGRPACEKRIPKNVEARRFFYTMQRLLNDAKLEARRAAKINLAGALAGIDELRDCVAWANGQREDSHDNMTAEQILARFRKERDQ